MDQPAGFKPSGEQFLHPLQQFQCAASEPGRKVVRGIFGLVVKGRSSGATSPFINEMKAPLLPRCRCVLMQCESDKENSEAGRVQEKKQRQKGDSSGNTIPPTPLETHHEQTDG